MDVLVGLIALAAGVAVCFAGLRVFKELLPIWGFIIGFLFGAALVSAIFGDGFLATTLGFIVGIVFGGGFAAIAFLWWYVGVLLAAGGAGSVFGISLFATFGVSSDWLLFLIGLITGVLFVFGALLFQFPIYMVVVSTAISGAAIAIGGVLLIFDRIDRQQIGSGIVWRRIDEHWFLWIVWAVVAAIGLGAQLQTARQVMVPEERWTRAA